MLRHKIKNLLEKGYNVYHYIQIVRCEKASLASKRKQWKKIRLTPEQKGEIKAVYGRRIGCKWHRLYQSYTGIYNKYYFPEILFSSRLETKLCPRRICKSLQDKSLVEILYATVPGLKFPKTIIVNSSGLYYDTERNIISKEEAVAAVLSWCKENAFIIKPTVGSMAGDKFMKFESASVDREDILELFRSYGKNFIIQECMRNHESIRALYDKSYNTFRIMTYILNDKLYHAPLILRIGRFGKVTDDEIYIGVSEDGVLADTAISYEGERYLAHPDTNIRFAGIHIPGVRQLVECAYACHRKTPHTKFISWDFSLNEEGAPILIEANMLGHSVWFPQIVYGVGIFGENTRQALELIGICRE